MSEEILMQSLGANPKPEAKEEVKKKHSFLKKEIRADFIASLSAHGIDGEKLSDEEILTKISHISADLTRKVFTNDATVLQSQLNEYAKTNGCVLKDKEFIARLHKLNVPVMYLKLFRDHDSALSDSQLWKRIRESGINPYKDRSLVTRPYNRS